VSDRFRQPEPILPAGLLAAGPPDLGAGKLQEVEGLCKFGHAAVREDMIKQGPLQQNRGRRMNASLLAVLNDAERQLVAETERAKLAAHAALVRR
jgi:hypothetical protein